MPLEAFNSSASIIDVLSGGVSSAGRSVLLGQQSIQTDAVRSIEESFASRIDEAISRLNQTDTNPKISALRREQSILVSRKTRLNEAIELLNKTLTQTKLIKNAINHLEDLLDDLDNGTITPSAVATDWDNTLRKINILVEGATVTFKNGGVSQELNLIKSDGSRNDLINSDGSRTVFSNRSFLPSKLNLNRSFLAPFNSSGDTLLINGSFLGTDYTLQEVTGNFGGIGNLFNGMSRTTIWKSDTAFLATEAETGTLTEFTSREGFPGSPTGLSGSVNNANEITSGDVIFANFAKNFSPPEGADGSTDAHEGKNLILWLDAFTGLGSARVHVSSVEKGGLGILDAWLYNDFEALNFANTASTLGTRTRARDDLGVEFLVNTTAKTSDRGAMTKVVFAEKQFKHALNTLQSRANFFDPLIAGIETEISDITETSLSEKEAIVASLKLASQVAQFDLAILASRGDTIVSSLLLSQDNFNNGLGSSFKATGDALLGATLSIQA